MAQAYPAGLTVAQASAETAALEALAIAARLWIEAHGPIDAGATSNNRFVWAAETAFYRAVQP